MAVRERTEEVRHVEFRASENGDGQTLEGYAAVFNEWTDIRDSLGTYKERIAPGAFKRSIGQRTPVLQFDHGTHPLIGSLPLGPIAALREDRNGLFVRARISDNWLMEPVRDAIREKAVNGMSFRFRVVDDKWNDEQTERTISEVELLELGPVVFPAYEQTSVAVRSLVKVLDDGGRAELARALGGQRFTDMMNNDVREMLRTALLEKYAPTDDQWVWVRDHNDTTVIFDLEGFPDPGTFRLSYTIQDNVAVLDGDAVPVTVNTTYVDGRDDKPLDTSAVAAEPVIDDSPDEPPVASHETYRLRIAAAREAFRHHPPKENPNVDQ